jgi:parallel beta-helix repeat protein
VSDCGATYTYEADGQGAEIAYNIIHDSGHTGIYLDNSSRNFIVHNNVVWNAPNAMTLNSPSNNNLVYNNTLVASSNSIYTGWFGGPDWSGTQIKNNIFTQGLSSASGATMSNNIDAGTNPQFVDPATGNFQLKSTSPAINAGAVLSPYTDGYVGSAPDIGAYEYGQTPWTAGATPSNPNIPPAPSNLTAALNAKQVTLTWQDNSSNETGFVVERSTDGQTFTTIATTAANATSYTDTPASLGQYWYRVSAQNGTYISMPSNTASVNTGTSAFTQIAATSFVGQSGTDIQGSAVGSIDSGDYLQYHGVDFGTGASAFTASVGVPAAYAGQQLELHLDSITGPVIGTLTIASTGDWGTFAAQTTAVAGATGVHDLFLVGKGTAGICNLASFRFTSSGSTTAPTTTSTSFPQIAATSFVSQSGTTVAGNTVGSIDNGDYLQYQAVDFGTGATTFTASVAVPATYAGQQLVLHVDSLTGPVIGTLTISSTGDWATFAPESTSISGVTGVHDLFLIGNGSFGICDLNYFQLSY